MTRHRASRPTTPARGADAAPARVGEVALSLLWVAPVLVLPGVYHRWGWPTLIAAVVAVGLAVWARPTGRVPVWWAALAAAVALALTLRALLGEAPLAQFFGRAPRYEGFVELAVLLAAVWCGARLAGPRAATSAHRAIVRAMTVASSALALVAVLEAVGLRPIETDLERPGSLAGNATDQGILGVVFAAWLFHVALGVWMRTRRVAWWAVVGGVAGVIAVVTSASRAALLGLAVVALVLSVRAVWGARRRAAAIGWTAVGFTVLVGFTLAVPFTRDRLLGADGFARKTVGDRLVIWRDALDLAWAHPWTGVGLNGYMDAITSRFDDTWYRNVTPDHVLDSPHDLLVQAAVVAGIPGVVLVLVGAALVFFSGVRAVRGAVGPRRDALIGAWTVLAGASIGLLASPTSPKTLLPMAVAVGVLVAREPWDRRWRALRILGTVAVAAWMVALLAWTVGDAFVWKGVSAAVRGDAVAADSAFSSAASLRPWDVDLPLIAAQVTGGALEQGMVGASDSASRWSTEAAARLPSSAAAQEAAGMVALQRGELAAAGAYLRAARALSPANPRIAHEEGLAELAAGDYAAARDAFERVLQLQPDREESRQALAEACRRLPAGSCL